MVCYALSVGKYLLINILKYHSTFISIIRQPEKSELLGLLYPEDEGNVILQKFSNNLPINLV
jgi:hypothetical protein